MNILLWQTIVVSGVLATCTGAAYTSHAGNLSYEALISTVHGVACALWFGASLWAAAFQGVTMIKVIPRHAFSASQGAVFPVLFQFGDICTALALATFCMLHPPTTLTSTAEIVQAANLLLCFLCCTINTWYLVPVGVDIMRKCNKIEKEFGIGQTIRHLDLKPLEGNEPYWKLRNSFGLWHEASRVTATVSCLCIAFRVASLASRIQI